MTAPAAVVCDMRTTKTGWLAALLLGAGTVFAQSDAKNVVTDAIDNTFEEGNYSWTSTLTTPRQETLSVSGQRTALATWIEVSGPLGTRTTARIGDDRYVKSDNGWIHLGDHEDAPPADILVRREARGERRPIVKALGPGGPGARDPEQAVRDVTGRVENWTVVGSQLTGSFSGLPHGIPGRGGEALASGSVLTTVTLTLREGVLSEVRVKTEGSFVDRAGASREIARTTTHTFWAVGTTTVSLPAELQAKLALAH